MKASSRPAIYRWDRVAMVRATTYAGGVDPLPRDLDLFTDIGTSEAVAWLSKVWQNTLFVALLHEASPGLVCRAEAVLATANDHTCGGSAEARKVWRVVASVAFYLLRWRGRPTPFGRMAGVAPAAIGAAASVAWGEQHRSISRLDAGWVGDVVDQLHASAELRDRLPVATNDTAIIRGNRVVVPGAPPRVAMELAPVEVSMRATRPVVAALDAALVPIRLGELRRRLTGMFPTATAVHVDDLLAALLEQRILVSALWAPLTTLDPLGQICATLQAAEADSLPSVRDIDAHLRTLHTQQPAPTSAASPSHLTARDASGAIPPPRTDVSFPPLIRETVLDGAFQLPEQVVREARDAVAVMFRTSPFLFGYPAWRDYHAEFKARYGIGALVPLLELVGDSGLGMPAGFLGAARPAPARQLSIRDEKILALAQRATLDGSGEIALTDAIIDDIAAGSAPDGAVSAAELPSRVEVAVEVRARTIDALTSGAFTLVVTGTPRPGSSMAGRHTHLMPPPVREAWCRSYAAAEPGAVAAQLSFAPRKRRNDNVARTDRLLRHVISLGEYPNTVDAGRIAVTDLAVTADASRFRLVQMSTGCHLEPRVLHALEAGVHTPPLARFLAEITTARCAVYKTFHLGAAAALPYLPRVRYGRTILAPARWLLHRKDLPTRAADAATWEAAWKAWRTRYRIPDEVALVEQDRRLPLDLRHRLDRSLLRTRLDRVLTVELRESAAPGDWGWIGRAHEVLIPLTLDQPHPGLASSSGRSRSDHPTPVEDSCRVEFPSRSDVVVTRIHGHPARHDELLTEHLPDLLARLGGAVDRWWFHRHRSFRRPDTDQYLSMHLQLNDPASFGSVAARLSAWAEDRHRSGLLPHLTIATHTPHPGRFGHGATLRRAHAVFAADSVAALAQIRLVASSDISAPALAAVSMLDIAVGLAGTVDRGLAYVVDSLPHDPGPVDPTHRSVALRLADPERVWTELHATVGGDDVVTAWHARAAALDAYRNALAEHGEPFDVARSLLHLHHIRAQAVDPDLEKITVRLTRACALRHIHHGRKASR